MIVSSFDVPNYPDDVPIDFAPPAVKLFFFTSTDFDSPVWFTLCDTESIALDTAISLVSDTVRFSSLPIPADITNDFFFVFLHSNRTAHGLRFHAFSSF